MIQEEIKGSEIKETLTKDEVHNPFSPGIPAACLQWTTGMLWKMVPPGSSRPTENQENTAEKKNKNKDKKMKGEKPLRAEILGKKIEWKMATENSNNVIF